MRRFSPAVILIILLSFFPISLHAQNPSEKLDLEWENSGEITFLVDSNQWFQFSIGLNSTSINSQNLQIAIIGDTSWGINDTIFLIKNQDYRINDNFILESDENIEITVQIFIPDTNNGTPLSNVNFPFKLNLNDETGKFSSWNYSITIRPKYSINIDEIIERKEIKPLGNSIHEIKIRNSGNIFTRIIPEIYPITDSGEVIENTENTRFSFMGWNATISGFIENIIIQPNASNNLKISVSSPYEPEGNLSILVKIKTEFGSIEESIFLNSSIKNNKNIEMEINNNQCLDLTEKNNCKLDLKIINLGDYMEIINDIYCTSTTEYIYFSNNSTNLTIYDSTDYELYLEPNEVKNFDFYINSTISRIIAGSKEEIICYHQRLNAIEMDSDRVVFEINTFHNISNNDNTSQWIEDNRFFFSIILENNGNIAESFSVGISVSHEVNHSLLIPTNASYDKEAKRIRSYIIDNIHPNNILNVTGWMNIPDAQFQDENYWISININSIPNLFEESWKVNNVNITSSIEDSNGNSEILVKSNLFLNIFNTYGYPSIAILISITMIIKAISLKRKNKETNKFIEQDDDWMKNFYEKKDEILNLKSPEIDKNIFENEFVKNYKTKDKDYSIPKIDINKIKNATHKLDIPSNIDNNNISNENESDYDF